MTAVERTANQILDLYRETTGDPISIVNFGLCVANIAALLERNNHERLNGAQKKQTVMRVVDLLIDESIADGPEGPGLVERVLRDVTASVIDSLVTVDKRQLKIHPGAAARLHRLCCSSRSLAQAP